LAGYLFDFTGNYQLAFIFSGITAIVAGIFMALLKPASREPT
jgi:sugar phosphate permease